MSEIDGTIQNAVSAIQHQIEKLAERAHETNDQLTPLMLAAKAGQESEALVLLARGDDVNAQSVSGWTALLKAVSGHRPNIIRLLAKHEAELSSSSRGFTALHLAALLDDTPCAEALLECGADPNVQDKEYGMTPLLEAMSEGDGDFIGPHVARLLIERGADMTIRDNEDKTVLDYALNYYDCWAEYPESVWLGENQKDLIAFVRREFVRQSAQSDQV